MILAEARASVDRAATAVAALVLTGALTDGELEALAALTLALEDLLGRVERLEEGS